MSFVGIVLINELKSEAEVDYLDDMLVNHEVFCFHVSVNVLSIMHLLERCKHLKTYIH